MPHQCTGCGHAFPDGSKEMLSGCPNCGGNKFQYFAGEIPENPPDAEPPEPDSQGVSGKVGRAARTVRDFVGDTDDNRSGPRSVRDGTTRPPSRSTEDFQTEDSEEDVSTDSSVDTPASSSVSDVSETQSTPDAEESPRERGDSPTEADAQTEARSDVVDADSLPEDVEGDVVATPSGERPDMATLREELNDQFESIRIVDKGQYELNLMELYDREEYIIALQENGRYVIEVPDAWREADE
jgi:predicted  nucleic acid-binding Zn-ribbon protein